LQTLFFHIPCADNHGICNTLVYSNGYFARNKETCEMKFNNLELIDCVKIKG